MNLIEKITNKLSFTSAGPHNRVCTILIYLFLFAGCNVNNALIAEMETAYKLPSNSSTESNKHVTDIIGKRFHKGMKILNALNELKKNDFSVGESMRNGYRVWPDGEFKRWTAGEIKNKEIFKHYPSEKQKNYYAEFTYWPSWIEKRIAVVIIETNSDDIILSSKGAIYVQTL